MHSLIDRVRRTIRHHALIPSGSRVVIGLSGGADSVALAVLLSELAPDGPFEIARLAHLHHGLRGTAADEDEQFCRTLAAELALPIDVERVDVRALARDGRLSLEEAGRDARYRFFSRTADLVGADRIAVGHTLEDQAETFLMNLLRGAGARGLAGMHPRSGRVIRPLLEVRHAELREFLAARGMTFREDETNQDTSLLRNRVRHVVMPFLEEHVSPGVRSVLARNAALARDDAAWLELEACRAWDRVAAPADGGIDLDCAALAREPPALARRVALRALEAVSGPRFVGFDHVDALLAMAGGEAAVAAGDFPGQRAERRGNLVALRRREGPGRGRRAAPGGFCCPLPVPGEARVAEVAATITAELVAAPFAGGLEEFIAGAGGRVAVVDAAAVSGGLQVRSRQPGDRFTPLGLAGTKKLQDFLVDRKVAEATRDKVPLVVTSDNRIVWVAGHAVCGDFRVTAGTRAVVILKVDRWGDRV